MSPGAPGWDPSPKLTNEFGAENKKAPVAEELRDRGHRPRQGHAGLPAAGPGPEAPGPWGAGAPPGLPGGEARPRLLGVLLFSFLLGSVGPIFRGPLQQVYAGCLPGVSAEWVLMKTNGNTNMFS